MNNTKQKPTHRYRERSDRGMGETSVQKTKQNQKLSVFSNTAIVLIENP